MYSHLQEHLDFHYASDSDADYQEAEIRGAGNPNRAWICTDRDVWHKNPFYKGPRVPHPESYEAECDAYNFENLNFEENENVPF